jgi:hypothetical protein
VGNYGCQVWGVEFLNFNDDSHVFENPLQKLLFVFLRVIYQGVIGAYTLLLEFGFTQYQMQYARLCAHYWNKSLEGSSLSGKHFKANILLFSSGNQICWTEHFLRCTNKLGLGPAESSLAWDP